MALLASAGADDAAKPSYMLVVTPVQRVQVELTLEMKAPKLLAREWVVYAARLPELTSQTDVRSTLFPRGQPIRELSAQHRPVLFERLPASGQKGLHELSLRVEYEAVLHARRLVRRKPGMPDPPAVAPLSASARRLALAESHLFDFSAKPFQAWLDEHKLRRQPKEREIDFACKVFLEMKEQFQFFHAATMDRRASRVCEAGQSDSGGLAIALVSALRANGIPARVLSGRLALKIGSEPGQEVPPPEHVMAEFFATGVGWVPADITRAVLDQESPDKLRYFGNDPGDFLTLHIDPDLEFDSIHFGRQTIEWLHSPAFWVTGSGTLDDQKVHISGKLERELLDPRVPTSPKPSHRGSRSPIEKAQPAPLDRSKR
jgi:hypothetical protein